MTTLTVTVTLSAAGLLTATVTGQPAHAAPDSTGSRHPADDNPAIEVTDQ